MEGIIISQCEIKGECNIALIKNRRTLMRLTLVEDYIQMLSTPTYYLQVKINIGR